MPTNQEFPYDVVLSHSAKDKAVLCPLAERRPLEFGLWICESRAAKGEALQTLDGSNERK